MKKNNVRYVIISIVLIIVILIGLSSINNDNKPLKFFSKSIHDTGTYISKIFYSPIKFVKDKIGETDEKKDLYKKYTKLKEKVEKTDLYYAEIKELQKEVSELKSTLELNSTLSEYTYVNATVVNRDMSGWYNTLNIDKGSKSGIKDGDAVIINSGLVGKIIKVSNFSSTVKLLTTDEINNKISIKISNDDDYYGLLIGYDKEKNVYKIEGITESDKISKGNMVTTTGLTDYFPSGILIGHVSNIVKDEYDLNSIIEVVPSVNFDNISIVTVLNRKAKE